MNNYVDNCISLEVLNQDSGLLPKPFPSWNTFVPKKGDRAYVLEENAEYEFDGKKWIFVEKVEDDFLMEVR